MGVRVNCAGTAIPSCHTMLALIVPREVAGLVWWSVPSDPSPSSASAPPSPASPASAATASSTPTGTSSPSPSASRSPTAPRTDSRASPPWANTPPPPASLTSRTPAVRARYAGKRTAVIRTGSRRPRSRPRFSTTRHGLVGLTRPTPKRNVQARFRRVGDQSLCSHSRSWARMAGDRYPVGLCTPSSQAVRRDA